MPTGTSSNWYDLGHYRNGTLIARPLWKTALVSPTWGQVATEALANSSFLTEIGFNSLTDNLAVIQEVIVDVATDANYATETTLDSILARAVAAMTMASPAYRFTSANPSPTPANATITGAWLETRIANPAGGNLADYPALSAGHCKFSAVATQPGTLLVQSGDSPDNNPPAANKWITLATIPLALDANSGQYVATGNLATLAFARIVFQNGPTSNEVQLMLSPGPLGATPPVNTVTPQLVTLSNAQAINQFAVNGITVSGTAITPTPGPGIKVQLVGLTLVNTSNNAEVVRIGNVANATANEVEFYLPAQTTVNLSGIDVNRSLIANLTAQAMTLVFGTPPGAGINSLAFYKFV